MEFILHGVKGSVGAEQREGEEWEEVGKCSHKIKITILKNHVL